MNLKQLQLICEMVKADFSVSRTADAMSTSQPGISALLKNLEDELSVKIFIRHGKRVTGLSEAGKKIYQYAQDALFNIQAIRTISQEFNDKDKGTLDIAATHTQARYLLPPIIKKFTLRYPKVKLRIRQGNPTQIAEMVIRGEADFGIATECLSQTTGLITFPVYQWNRCVVVPNNHALLEADHKITLEEIAALPIVTYDFAFTGRSVINQTFKFQGLKPNIILTAMDSDIIKTYVELGLGIGLLANMAFEPETDKNLRKIDVSHLFEDSTTYIGFRKGQLRPAYIYDFLSWLAPHLTKETIEKA